MLQDNHKNLQQMQIVTELLVCLLINSIITSIFLVSFLRIWLSLISEKGVLAWRDFLFKILALKFSGNIFAQTWLGLGCSYCFATFWSFAICWSSFVISVAAGVDVNYVLHLLFAPLFCGGMLNFINRYF